MCSNVLENYYSRHIPIKVHVKKLDNQIIRRQIFVLFLAFKSLNKVFIASDAHSPNWSILPAEERILKFD
jgi:hypothetical protein